MTICQVTTKIEPAARGKPHRIHPDYAPVDEPEEGPPYHG